MITHSFTVEKRLRHNVYKAAPGSISVIIPTHNRLDTLGRAISSALEQTRQPLEIIVVDDGSTDGTADWLHGLDSPIRAIYQSNHGVSHARNRGIEAAKGEWLALLDSDDYWQPDKLHRQMQVLASQPEIRFCHCNEIWIRNGKRINQKKKHTKRGGHIFEHCLPLCVISPSAAVIHRDLFTNYGLFDETLPACEDYDLWLRIAAREPLAFVDEPLLIKTGGHPDQLSARYPHMDMYRLRSLAGLLRSDALNSEQYDLALQMFLHKFRIVKNGAIKHKNTVLSHTLSNSFSDIVDADPASGT